MHQLETMSIDVPVKMGDVIIHNVCDTGTDVVASRNID